MKNRKIYIIPLTVFTIGIILGSLFDLQVSSALYSSKDVFGLAMASFGHWVGYSFLALMAGFIFRSGLKEKVTWQKICEIALGVVGYFASTWLAGKEVSSVNGYNTPELKWLWVIVCGVLFAAIFFFGNIYGKKNENKAIILALFILVVFMMIELIPVSQILKSLVRRPRYRVVANDAYGYQASFTNWWETFKGFDDLLAANPTADHFSEHFRSFPSGHAGVAGIMMFGLPYLTLIEEKLKGKEFLLFIIGFIFTLLMCLSRIIVGAHYLSDVSFGGLFMTIFCIIANEINLRFVLKNV